MIIYLDWMVPTSKCNTISSPTTYNPNPLVILIATAIKRMLNI